MLIAGGRVKKRLVLKRLHPTEYFNSLIWIKENDPSELELAFQVKIFNPLSLSLSLPKPFGRNDSKAPVI